MSFQTTIYIHISSVTRRRRKNLYTPATKTYTLITPATKTYIESNSVYCKKRRRAYTVRRIFIQKPKKLYNFCDVTETLFKRYAAGRFKRPHHAEKAKVPEETEGPGTGTDDARSRYRQGWTDCATVIYFKIENRLIQIIYREFKILISFKKKLYNIQGNGSRATLNPQNGREMTAERH